MGSGGILEPVTGDKSPQESQSANQLAGLAQMLAQETAPIRQGLIGQSMDFLGGGLDVTQNPQYGALKQATEQQFDTARQRVLGSVPTGGGLSQALTDIELGRAGAMTQGVGNLAAQQQQQALGLATGQTGQAISALGGAGGIQAQQAQAQAAQNAATKQGIGQIAGGTLGGKAIAASDVRLKKNLRILSRFKEGINLWAWEWRDEAKKLGIDTEPVGFIAQEVMQVLPSAVSKQENGYLIVDYNQVKNYG